jgi:hypothetical protein
VPSAPGTADPAPAGSPGAGEAYGLPSRWDFRPPHPLGEAAIGEMELGPWADGIEGLQPQGSGAG